MKLIRNEEDCDAALARIGEIMAAQPGTSEFDELEVLGVLVENYEEKHHPVALPDPIEAIKFRMEQSGARQRDLVPFIGSASKVSEVLSRKRPLTLAMMKALHAGFGIPAEVFLRESRGDESVPSIDAARLPWGEIVKRGWMHGFHGTAREARGRADELMASLFPKNAGACLQPALYRRSVRGQSSMDEYAVMAWTARIVWLACRQDLSASYSPGTLDKAFMAGLVQLSFLDDGPKLAREYLAKYGIHLVFERSLPRTRIDGAATLLPDGSPVIGLSLRYDRLDNFWFCLAHELAHVALHLGEHGDQWFVDDLESEGGDQEQEADAWAREALIAAEEWRVAGDPKSEADVRKMARKLSISPAIIAGRLRWERQNYRLLTDLIGQGQVRKHFLN